MLRPRLLAGLLAHLAGDLSAQRPHGHHAFDHRRRRRLALGQHRLTRLPCQHVAVAHQLIHQVHPPRRAGPQHLARQHDLHGIDRPGLADRAPGAPEAGENPEIDLGEADARLLVIDRDAVVAGQRQLEPPAQAEAVNTRHHRYLEPLDALEQRMGALQRLRQHREIAHRIEFGDIGPGDKAAILAAEQHHARQFPGLGQFLEAGDQGLQLHDGFPAQRIDRRAGRIDGQPADLFDIALEPPVPGLGHLRLDHICSSCRMARPFRLAQPPTGSFPRKREPLFT